MSYYRRSHDTTRARLHLRNPSLSFRSTKNTIGSNYTHVVQVENYLITAVVHLSRIQFINYSTLLSVLTGQMSTFNPLQALKSKITYVEKPPSKGKPNPVV